MNKTETNKEKIIEKKHRYDSVDLMKFIGSIMIFTMHLNAFNDYEIVSFIFRKMTQWGVPFFFVTSSFFLFSKSENGNISKNILTKYIKRILFLYLVYFVINIPSIVYERLITDGITNPLTWIGFCKEALLSSTFTGSWYLNSSIICAVCIYLLSKKLNTKVILIIGGIVELICLLSSQQQLLPDFLYNAFRFLCFPLNSFGGMFFFAVGKFIFEKRNRIFNVSIFVYVFIFIISCILYISENIGLFGINLGVGLIPLSVSLVIIVFKISINIKNHITLRKLSTIIYCGQGNVLVVCGFIRNTLHLNYLTKALIGYVLISIFAILVLAIQKSNKFKWAKYLT